MIDTSTFIIDSAAVEVNAKDAVISSNHLGSSVYLLALTDD